MVPILDLFVRALASGFGFKVHYGDNVGKNIAKVFGFDLLAKCWPSGKAVVVREALSGYVMNLMEYNFVPNIEIRVSDNYRGEVTYSEQLLFVFNTYDGSYRMAEGCPYDVQNPEHFIRDLSTQQ